MITYQKLLSNVEFFELWIFLKIKNRIGLILDENVEPHNLKNKNILHCGKKKLKIKRKK